MVEKLGGGIAEHGLKRHYISFGGVSTYDYNCVCDGSKTFGSPQYNYEEITVPGRNGKLYYDNGYFENTEVTYSMFFTDVNEFRDFANRIYSLRGYQRLEDSHHPEEYRMAIFTSAMEPDVSGYDNEYCTLELTFVLKPQRFLKSGEDEKTITNGGELYNPTLYFSKPLIDVYCSGSTASLIVNDTSTQYRRNIIFHSLNLLPYVTVDCETQNVYFGDVDHNSLVVCKDFPILQPGNNKFTLSYISKIVIRPRWWKV